MESLHSSVGHFDPIWMESRVADDPRIDVTIDPVDLQKDCGARSTSKAQLTVKPGQTTVGSPRVTLGMHYQGGQCQDLHLEVEDAQQLARQLTSAAHIADEEWLDGLHDVFVTDDLEGPAG